MKRIICIVLCVMLANIAGAQEESRPLLRGEFLTDQRLLMNEDHSWAWSENRLDLKLEKRQGKLKFYSNIWLRHLGGAGVQTVSGLYSKDQINPWNLDLREAYAEVNGFLAENLDLKIGRQRIAWGTADKFNPTDNINPYDFEDLFDFGRHQGSEAINLIMHFGEQSSLQGVYVPFFRPSNLPLGVFSGVLTMPMIMPEGLTVSGIEDKLDMPAYNFSEGASAGLRFKTFLKGFDFSLSYLYGRDGLPLLTSVTFVPTMTLPNVNLETEFCFPRMHIIGADMAGSIGSVGVWAEAAVFVPEKEIHQRTDLSLIYPALPVPMVMDTITLSKDPWLKLAIGADYTFHNGAYLNVQYLRGFIHERGQGNMNDYLLLSLEKGFFNGELVFRPLAGSISVTDMEAVSDNYAVFYTPEIIYKGIDNFQIGFGAYIFEGKGTGIFAGLNELDMLQLKAKLNF